MVTLSQKRSDKINIPVGTPADIERLVQLLDTALFVYMRGFLPEIHYVLFGRVKIDCDKWEVYVQEGLSEVHIMDIQKQYRPLVAKAINYRADRGGSSPDYVAYPIREQMRKVFYKYYIPTAGEINEMRPGYEEARAQVAVHALDMYCGR